MAGTKGQGEGGRLREGPAAELKELAFGLEIADAPILLHGCSLADLAHILMLLEVGVVPQESGARLLGHLLELHKVPVEDFPLDAALEDVYSNREAWVRARDEEAAGWLGAGRPRREPATIAYRLAVRERLLGLCERLVDMVDALCEQAAAHIGTIMPDYTYLQPATPTSLAHYLLSFAYPLLRDLDRLRSAYDRTDRCPGGIGNINGTRLPVDRARLSDLLGFAAPIENTRDAMWQVDQPVEVMADLMAIFLHLDRLAEDLQIWNTREFGLAELADRHARISLIMPQKKNPYALAFIRGITGTMVGRLVSMISVGKSPSAQMDNRIFALGEVPRSLDSGIKTVKLAAEVVRGLSFNTELMQQRATEGFIHATDLAETIMRDGGATYRQAHRLVGLAVRNSLERDPQANDVPQDILDAAAIEVLGRPLGIAPEVLAGLTRPADIVATRQGLGGAAAEPVHAMLEECAEMVSAHREFCSNQRDRIRASEAALLSEAGLRAG
ncbi:MAG: argininosuccinate lyase [Deltaproteobacteria bacterium]